VYNLARNVAGSLGIKTIGAKGYVSPVLKDGKETGELSAGPFHNVSYNGMGFYLFEPVKVTKTVETFKTFLGIRIPFTEREVKVTKTEIKETYLGPIINPSKLIP
jgi:hypothetical protein